MSGEDLLVMENFSMVEAGVYRSAFPRSKNVAFLARLGLKSVVSLVPEDYPDKLLEHYKRLGIVLIPMGIDGNKWPFKAIDMPKFREALAAVLRPEHRPCLVHCNKGKHRTGCLIASLRLVRGWGLSPAFAEYLTFSGARERLEDQIFIEVFLKCVLVCACMILDVCVQIGDECERNTFQPILTLTLTLNAPHPSIDVLPKHKAVRGSHGAVIGGGGRQAGAGGTSGGGGPPSHGLTVSGVCGRAC